MTDSSGLVSLASLAALALPWRKAYLDRMKWSKDGEGWVCRVLPDAIFVMKVQPKGDGRWTWEVFPKAGGRSIATGVVSSLGAAKTTSENFVNRSGKI